MAGEASKKRKRSALEPLFLLDDEPIERQDKDLFPTDTFARVIARAALGTKGPFTIGVYGGWGSGKTSALRAAKSMIDDDPTWAHVVTVNFNAWQYEREQHPTIPLVAAIEDAIRTKLEANKKLSTKAFNFANKSLWFVVGVLGAFLAATSGKVEGKVEVPLLAEGGIGIDFDGKEFVERVEKAAKGGEPPEPTHWEKFRDATLYLSIFDRLQALHTAAENMGGDSLRKFPRVVVFLDDLDRCQAEKAFELLESVKLVLSQPGFVFVLALNHDVVSAYLDHLAEKRYGEKRSRVHDSYLDKIVQLPLTMPSRRAAFESFATQLIGSRLDSAANNDLRAGLQRLARVLAVASGATPRTLVRRVNRLLIDVELREEADLTVALKNERPPYERFAGLCLIQRTLEDALGLQRTRELAEARELCQHLAQTSIFETMDAVDEALQADKKSEDSAPRPKRASEGGGPTQALPTISPFWAPRYKELLDYVYQHRKVLYEEEYRRDGRKEAGTSVLTCAEGRDWLRNHEDRLAVMKYAAQRPAKDAPPAPDKKTDDSNAPTAPTTVSPFEPIAARLIAKGFDAKEVAEQRALIETKIRRTLKLAPDAPIRASECPRVTELDLAFDSPSDAVLALIAAKDSPLTALADLWLESTAISDAGLAHLAAKGSPLKTLSTLSLVGTNTTDAGRAAIMKRFPKIRIYF